MPYWPIDTNPLPPATEIEELPLWTTAPFAAARCPTSRPFGQVELMATVALEMFSVPVPV